MSRSTAAAFLGSFAVLAVVAVSLEAGKRPSARVDAGGAERAPAVAAPSEPDRHTAVSPASAVTSVEEPEPGYDTAISHEPPPGAAPATGATCPKDMVLVEGEYCTEVRQDCKTWLDDSKLPFARCGEYEQPSRCVGKRVRLRYCIDAREYTRPGESRPMNYSSFVTSSKTCKELGKRICTESEWNFACEGEEMRPYPYGYRREPKCNQDQPDLYETNRRRQVLKDLRQPSGSNPECKSPFGVYDMVGNMDEPVLREEARYATPFRNGLKGGWWLSGRNRCRPATTAHDDYYSDIQVGVRCCADLPGSPSGASG